MPGTRAAQREEVQLPNTQTVGYPIALSTLIVAAVLWSSVAVARDRLEHWEADEAGMDGERDFQIVTLR